MSWFWTLHKKKWQIILKTSEKLENKQENINKNFVANILNSSYHLATPNQKLNI